MPEMDVTVTIRFSVNVDTQEEADGLYDELMDKYFTGRRDKIPQMMAYLSQKLAEGAEVDIDEISQPYAPACNCPSKTPLGYHLERCPYFKEPKI